MGVLRHIKNRIEHDMNMKRLFERNAGSMTYLYNAVRQGQILLRAERLREKVMACKEMGITDELHCEAEIIVSLTTFGNRINEVYLAIESIMQGTLKPNRIVLWLSEEEFKGKTLPLTLQKQQARGLQIEYCEDIRSYKKIVPTLEKHPDACVVTIDDDAMYEFDLLENLVNAHLANPEDVCACRIHRITLDDDKRPKGYMQWEWRVWPKDKSNLNFLTGVGGCLYPPHCFVDEFFNREAFMSLCPYADDVWVNAMLWLSGRHVVKAYTHSEYGDDFIEVAIEQDDSLSLVNWSRGECRNDVQLKAVMDRYDLYSYLINENISEDER